MQGRRSKFLPLESQGHQPLGYMTSLHAAQESFRTWRSVGAEFSNRVMSLNEEIRSLPAGAEKTMRRQGLLWNTGSHAGLPAFHSFPKDSWRKAMFLLIAGPCPEPGAKPYLAGIRIRWLHGCLCGLETVAYEAKGAASPQLPFCKKETLRNLQSLHCRSLPAVSQMPMLD